MRKTLALYSGYSEEAFPVNKPIKGKLAGDVVSGALAASFVYGLKFGGISLHVHQCNYCRKAKSNVRD